MVGGLVNGYVNHEIGICAHFHAGNKSVDTEARDFVFVFQKSRTYDIHPSDTSSLWNSEHGMGSGSPRSEQVKLSMPVLSGPIVQNAEISIETKNHLVRLKRFRSVVRLYRFDPVLQILREWSNTPSGVLTIEPLRHIADGKLQVVLIGGRILSSFENCGLINASIESGSKLIDHLAEFEREAGRQRREFGPEENAACPVVLHAHGNRILIVVQKGVPSFGEGIAVNLCPFDALPTALEWSHNDSNNLAHFG